MDAPKAGEANDPTATQSTTPSATTEPNPDGRASESGADGATQASTSTEVGGTAAEPSLEDLRRFYKLAADKLPVEELLGHNRIGGIVGDYARRNAQDILDRDLRKRDPAAFVETLEKREAEEAKAREALANRTSTPVWQDVDEHLLGAFNKGLPPEVTAELAGKTYTDPDGIKNRLSYLTDAFNSAVKHEVEKAKTKMADDVKPALRQEAQSEARRSTRSPDSSVANAKSPARITRKALEAMSPEEMVANGVFDNWDDLKVVLNS